jgi:hypothetical protein
MACVGTPARRAPTGHRPEFPPVLRLAPALLLFAALAGACTSPGEYARQSDAIVEEILGGSSQRLNEERRATVVEPAQRVDAPESVQEAAPEPAQKLALSLRDAVRIAVDSNREYIGQLEQLYESALALYGVRHDFGPLLTASLNYAFAEPSALAKA